MNSSERWTEKVKRMFADSKQTPIIKAIQNRLKRPSSQHHFPVNTPKVGNNHRVSVSPLTSMKRRHLEYSFNLEDLEHAEQHIKHIVGKLVWPQEDHIHVEALHGGTTNLLYKCRLSVSDRDRSIHSQQQGIDFYTGSFLVRIYGASTDDIIDRDYEIQLLKALGKHNLRPQLYGTFDNGYVFEFLEGRAIKPHEMRDPHISQLIAKKCAKWHYLELPGKKKPLLWNRFENWLQLAEQGGQGVLPTGFTWDSLREEVASLKQFLSTVESPCVSAHNDLTAGNLIFDASKDSVSFIDFEYSGYNYRGFDIGNYFCEWAGLELDFTKFPSKEQQINFLRQYLLAQTETDNYVDLEDQLESMYAEVNAYVLASHLLWAVWAFLQMQRSSIEFDYQSYGLKRLSEYYKKKNEFRFL